jgi:acetylornithine deacetylase
VLGADKAVNAILASLPLIDAIRAMEREANARRDRPAPFRDMDHPLNYNVGTLHAGDWPSSVPSECVLEVRLSAFPGDDLAEVRDGFRRGLLRAAAADPWLAAHPPDIAFFAFRAEGCVLERSEPIFGSLASAHRLVMGGEPEYYASTATTDARFFNLYGGTPATCYGPVGGALHAPDEWVDLASVRHVTLVLALAVLDWCGGALEEVT